jgi:hypothetical protein
VNLPAVIIVVARGQMLRVPVDETLDIYFGRCITGLGLQRCIVANGPRAAVSGGLPVMVNLRMDAGIACGI